MKSQNTVFFQGNTQYENTGDILINKALILLLRKRGAIIVNDIAMPDWYVESLYLTQQERITNQKSSFNNYLLKEVFSAAFNKRKKIFLIAGPPGHLFGNSTQKSIRNIVSTFVFILLRIFGLKIIKIGFSMGPIGKLLAFTESTRANLIQHYLVRDHISLAFAKKIGIKHAGFFPDLAWTFDVEQPATPVVKNKMLVSFRNSVVQGTSNDEYLTKLKENLFAMLKKISDSYEIEITYQVERDYTFCKRLYEELKDDINVTFNKIQITLDNAIEYYPSAFCIITNRLHGALLGYKYGALPLVLTDTHDHLKIKGIYLDAGVGELLVNVYDNINENIATFNSLLSRRGEIMSYLNKKEAEYIEMSNNVLDNIFEIS